MKDSSLYGAIDFHYVLLEEYKRLNIDEKTLSVIFMIDHLLSQGNRMVTADILSLKMSLKIKEIDAVLADLLKRGYLVYETDSKGLKANLDPLKKRLYSDMAKRLESEELAKMDAQKTERIASLGAFLESKLDRGLSPIEQSTLREWVSAGYKDEEIKNAVLDCLRAGERNFRSIEKVLRQNRRRKDISKEGSSAVGESYDKNIEETLELAKEIFGKD